MTSESIGLKAEKRDLKANNNRLRKEGKIPAVLYGYKVENTPLTLNLGEFEKVLRKAGENTVVELSLGEGKSHHVLIQDVHMHGVKHLPIHVDFLEVNMTVKITANIPLEFVGEADAVKLQGGTLVKQLDEVEVEGILLP
jgi:large subunit ribosomal protein L25